MKNKYFKYDNYEEYIETQKAAGRRYREHLTKKHAKERSEVIELLKEHAPGSKTMLCLGSRHPMEVENFINAGYEAEGIDLFEDRHISICDMNRLDDNKRFKNKYYDIFVSIHSLEHCWNLEEFKEKTLPHCKEAFAIYTPRWNPKIDPTKWDCLSAGYASRSLPKEETAMALEDCFKGFKVAYVRISYGGLLSLLLREKI